MPNQSYIEAHELYRAYEALLLNAAGLSELQTLASYDIDPLADDLETWVVQAIESQCVSEFASTQHKRQRELA